MTYLEKAIIIAVQAHQGQVDKSSQAYVLHPLRMMLKLQTPEEQIVAVLHDVVEDTDVTMHQLAEAGFSDPVLTALGLLTHDKAIPYMNYIDAVAQNQLATNVKLVDLQDNMDMNRIPEPTDKDFKRLERYKVAFRFLSDAVAEFDR